MPSQRDLLRIEFLRTAAARIGVRDHDLSMGSVLHLRYTKGPDLSRAYGVVHYATRAKWKAGPNETVVTPEVVIVLDEAAASHFAALESHAEAIAASVGERVTFGKNMARWNVGCAGRAFDLRDAKGSKSAADWIAKTIRQLHGATRSYLP